MSLSLAWCEACDYGLIGRVWRVGLGHNRLEYSSSPEVEKKTLFTRNILKNTLEKEAPMQMCTASSFSHGVKSPRRKPTPLVTAPQGWGRLRDGVSACKGWLLVGSVF